MIIKQGFITNGASFFFLAPFNMLLDTRAMFEARKKITKDEKGKETMK